MDYTVVIHKAEEGGFWAEVPALPGCYSQGETIEETISNITEAVELYLQALAENGKPIPVDEDVVFKVAASCHTEQATPIVRIMHDSRRSVASHLDFLDRKSPMESKEPHTWLAPIPTG